MLITKQLPTEDLLTWRTTSTAFAEAGYDVLQRRVPQTIEYRDYRRRFGGTEKFLMSMKSGLQASLPQAAARVTRLSIECHGEALGDSLVHVRLPGLLELKIRGVRLGARSLESMLLSHRMTLRSLELERLNFHVGIWNTLNDDRPGPKQWLTLLNTVRGSLDLVWLMVGFMMWHDPVSRMPPQYLTLPLRRYHLKQLDANLWYRLSDRGFVAAGKVPVNDCIEHFTREAAKKYGDYGL